MSEHHQINAGTRPEQHPNIDKPLQHTSKNKTNATTQLHQHNTRQRQNTRTTTRQHQPSTNTKPETQYDNNRTTMQQTRATPKATQHQRKNNTNHHRTTAKTIAEQQQSRNRARPRPLGLSSRISSLRKQTPSISSTRARLRILSRMEV